MKTILKNLSYLFLFFSLFGSLFSAESYKASELESRFIKKNDGYTFYLANFRLRSTWWSRPYEYYWASQFVSPDDIVLDAGCGVAHPFKWYLGKRANEAWGCDIDARILSKQEILSETKKDLGEDAYTILLNNPSIIESVKLIKSSFVDLPIDLPKFDRIFCISTLEELNKEDIKMSLKKFSNLLKPNGLLILTVNYPVITPEELLKSANEAGLKPAGEYKTLPSKDALVFFPDNITSNQHLFIYRAVFKK